MRYITLHSSRAANGQLAAEFHMIYRNPLWRAPATHTWFRRRPLPAAPCLEWSVVLFHMNLLFSMIINKSSDNLNYTDRYLSRQRMRRESQNNTNLDLIVDGHSLATYCELQLATRNLKGENQHM